MNVVAQRGDTQFLIETDDGLAQVLSIESTPTVYPPEAVDAIISWGYWVRFESDPGPVLELLSRVSLDGDTEPGAGWMQRSVKRLSGVRVLPEDLIVRRSGEVRPSPALQIASDVLPENFSWVAGRNAWCGVEFQLEDGAPDEFPDGVLHVWARGTHIRYRPAGRAVSTP